MMAGALAPPPKSPAAPSPVRRRGWVRRTTSLDVTWPDGPAGDMHLSGRGRDVLTLSYPGEPVILGEQSVEVVLTPERRLRATSASPSAEGLQALVGERAGGHLRAAIAAWLPEEKRRGALLYLLLDDLSGASLVSPWAFSRFDPEWLPRLERMKRDPRHATAFDRENVCAGLRTGSSGLSFGADGIATPDLRNPADPQGWHDFPAATCGPSMRRARRIDVGHADAILIDAHFQDSATTPEGGRSALHEYELIARAEPASMTLSAVDAIPRVLPFAECPDAAASGRLLLGAPLSRLRELVLDRLRGPVGCTHLNDALRALAEVPQLLAAAERHSSPAET